MIRLCIIKFVQFFNLIPAFKLTEKRKQKHTLLFFISLISISNLEKNCQLLSKKDLERYK